MTRIAAATRRHLAEVENVQQYAARHSAIGAST